MTPIQLANCLVNPADIFGGDSVEEAATIFLNILNNKGTKEQDSVVISNAALALQLTGKYTDYNDAFAASKESLKSGKAINVLNTLNMFTPSLPSHWWCPGGNCSSNGNNQGISPLEQWSSPYA
jgi:anthranilate phosphoribosyltransferase